MGCFNIMGFHSHLPIQWDDDIVLLLGVYPRYEKKKVRKDYVEFACGTDFTPIALPIFGKYDEYGKIESIVRNRNVDMIEEFFEMPIDDMIKIVDDYMHGRYMSDNNSESYEKMCKKIYNYQNEFIKKGEFSCVFDVVFTIDHKFVYDTIKTLGLTYYDFKESINALMEFCPPWEDVFVKYPGKDHDDIKTRYENNEITEREFQLWSARNSFLGKSERWFTYLNDGKYFSEKNNDYVTNVSPRVNGYSYTNFWNQDSFNCDVAMCVYSDVDSCKTLFTELENEYIDYLKFIANFKNNQWCFRFHVYGTQGCYAKEALPYFQAIVNKCKEIINNTEDEDDTDF